MKISLVIPGRFKSRELETLTDYYTKLATRFATVSRATIHPAKGKDGEERLDAALEQFLDQRGSRVYLTLLDERGQTFTSRKFADKVEKIRDASHTEWIIAAGGAHGYGPALAKRAQLLWSLSPMTLPHELAASVAAEQVFRALSILNRHPYHNE